MRRRRPQLPSSPGLDSPGARLVPPRRPVNSLAVTSLICALLPGILPVIAVITGVAARRQIRETGERGSGMAATGVAIGGFAIVMFVILVLFGALGPR
jgi:hypothetical protein